jgi:hypothetical protein
MQEKLTPQLLGENWEPLITDNFDGCLNFDDTVLDKIHGKILSLQNLQYSGHEHKVIRDIASLNHLCKSSIFFQVRRIEKFKLKEKLK